MSLGLAMMHRVEIDLFFEYGKDMNKRFLTIKGISNKTLNEIS